jgi:glycosyltransferase involved in cell wall biosynthesis
MIVKNEARLVLRCLESVRPLVDYFLIEDTGSTDGTQAIVRCWLDQENLAGEVFEEPWQDFASNRSLALARLRKKTEIDYALIIDADDTLVCEQGFDAEALKAGLKADLYNVEIRLGSIRYHRPQLCSNRLEFRYRGVLHEFIERSVGQSIGIVTGLYIRSGVEGARSEDPDKYRKDAELLEGALQTEQDPFLRSRYTFYLAQSWKDCGEARRALTCYLDRAELGFWDEEIFISLYYAAQLKGQLDHPDHEIIGMFLRAYEACPRRAEALHGAARYCRAKRNYHQGYMLARQGLEIQQPGSGLFVDPWIYEYGLLDEFAVNAYWTERYGECLGACERLLDERKIPEEMRERVEQNAQFAREKLASRGTTLHQDRQVSAIRP